LTCLLGRGQAFTSEFQGATLELEGLAKDADLLSPDDGTNRAVMKLRDRSWDDTGMLLTCTLDRLPNHTVPEERPEEVRPVIWLHLCRIIHDFESQNGQPGESVVHDFFLVLEKMPQKQGRYRRLGVAEWLLGVAEWGSVEPTGAAARRSFPEEFFSPEDRGIFRLV
jgi:hypothetical protein